MSSLDDFKGKLSRAFKKQIIPISYKLLHNTKEWEFSSTSFATSNLPIKTRQLKKGKIKGLFHS